MSSDPDILEYYARLLIIQYHNKDKARATTKLLVNQSLCDGLVQAEAAAFDLETAVGAQLDIIGRIVGVPRNVYGLNIDNNFWNFTNYSETPPENLGWGRYADNPYGTDIWLRYNDAGSASYTLLDSQLRILIKLKIILNTTYSSTKALTEILWEFFGTDIEFIDNKDMTITYNIANGLSTTILAAIYLGLLPHPMGVGTEVNFI